MADALLPLSTPKSSVSPHTPSRTDAAASIMVAAEPSTGRDSSCTGTHRQGQSLAGALIDQQPGGSSNPFQIPSDEDIFRLQAEQRAERAAAQAAAAALSVRDKSTFASRQQALFTDDAVRASFQETKQLGKQVRDAASELDAGLAAAACAGVPRRVGRESIRELLAKKREMLLVQMSLDTKRAEIQKLQDRARQREEALQRSEAMLEEDAQRFDAFLKENDEKVQEAIKHADAEAKSKQDKVLEIKRLNCAITGLRSELSKQQERLEECKRYKDFLDSVTPAEWFAAQAAKQEARRQEQVAEWRAACGALQAKRDAAAAAKARAEAELSNAATQQAAERAERAIKAANAALREAQKLKDPPEPVFDAAAGAAGGSPGAPPPPTELYFTQPQQLLQAYADLEGSNLFLIQVCQEAEEAAEAARSLDAATREQLNSQAAALQAQISGLQAAIEAAGAKAATLRARAEQGAVAQGRLCLGGGGGGGGNKAPAAAVSGKADGGSGTAVAAGGAGGGPGGDVVSLEGLSRAVAAAYQRFGFEPDASLSTLAMLTSIEVRLEECLAASEALPAHQVAEAEKGRERERRQAARMHKAAAAAAEHELRVARALQRAAAPVYKKSGKPVMARSEPPRRRAVVEARGEGAEEEAELAAFLATDLL